MKLQIIIVIICQSLLSHCQEPAPDRQICSICKCLEDEIDCGNRKIESLVNLTWPNSNITYERINFDNNLIDTLTPLPNVSTKCLSFKFNQINRIEDDTFHKVQNLVELDLSGNNITVDTLQKQTFRSNPEIGRYDPISTLKILKLARNRLTSLIHDVFMHLPNVKELDLSENCFNDKSYDFGAFKSLDKIQKLDLSYSQIQSLPQYLLPKTSELKILNISGNLFTELPRDTLAEFRSLEILIMNDNPISAITTDNAFPELLELRELHISFMKYLTRIEAGSLKNLMKLDYLDCQFNKNLSFISPAALYHSEETDPKIWPWVKKLILNDNNLTSLSNEFLARWDKLDYIDIRGNKFSCDCTNQFLVSSLTNTILKIDPKLVDGITCSSPEEMEGRTFIELNKKKYKMRCLDTEGSHPENDSAMLVGVFVGVLIGIPITIIAYLVLKRGKDVFLCREGGPINYPKAFYQRQVSDDDEVI